MAHHANLFKSYDLLYKLKGGLVDTRWSMRVSLHLFINAVYFNCDALRDFVLFVQFKKHAKHPWRSVTFSKVAGWSPQKSYTPPWVFFTFFKLYKWYQIPQSLSSVLEETNVVINFSIDPFYKYASENQRFDNVFRGYRNTNLAWNGLNSREL